MPLSIFRKGNAIGASISDASIELCELAPASGGAFSVRTSSRVSLAEGVIAFGKIQDHDAFVSALRTCISHAKPLPFGTTTVDVAIPDIATYFHIFTLPGSLSESEIARALPFAAEELIPFPPEDLVGDFRVASRTQGDTTVVYAVALREVVTAYADAISKAGLRPGRFVLEADALASSLLPVPTKDAADVVIDIGERSTVIFVRDAFGLRATFSEPVAGAYVTQAIAKATSLPFEKAEALKCKYGIGRTGNVTARRAARASLQPLFNRMSRVFAWYDRLPAHGTISRVIITGGSSMMPGIVDEIASHIIRTHPKAQIQTGDPFGRLQDVSRRSKTSLPVKRSDVALYAPAIGAALLALERNPTFDFLNPSRAASGMFRRRTNRRAGSSVIAVSPGASSRLPTEAAPAVEHAPVEEDADETALHAEERRRLIAAAVFCGIAVFGLIGAFVYRWQTSKRIEAEIRATAQQKAAEAARPQVLEAFSTPLSLSLDASRSRIPIRRIDTTETQELSVIPASGEQQRTTVTPEVEVTLINTTDSSIDLIARTRLLSSGGILYRLTEPVSVAGQRQVTTTAIADVEGESSVLTGPDTFVLPGLSETQQALIYAESSTASTPGIQTVYTGEVTQQDVDTALAQLRSDLSLHAVELVGTQLEDGEVIVDNLIRLSVDPVEVQADTTATIELPVRVYVHTTAVIAMQDDVTLFARQAAMARYGWTAEDLDMFGTVQYSFDPLLAPYAGEDPVTLMTNISVVPHDS